MRYCAMIFTVLLAGLLPLSASSQFAMVRIRDIYSKLPSTVQMQEKMKQDREAIMRDERAVKLRAAIAELQALQAQLSDQQKPLDEAAKVRVSRSFEIKRQEAATLQQDFEKFKTQREKEINQEMVRSMRKSLNEIVDHSQKIAAKNGYLNLLDPTGNSNTTVPFVIYQKDAPDITDEVIASLTSEKKAP